MTTLDKIVSITSDYLGPAAPRFINRQMSFHLDKNENSTLTTSDITKIAESVRVGLGLLTQDKKQVDEAYTRIIKLSKEKN